MAGHQQLIFGMNLFIVLYVRLVSNGVRKPKTRKVFASYYTAQVGRVRKSVEEGIDSCKFAGINSLFYTFSNPSNLSRVIRGKHFPSFRFAYAI